MEPMEIEDVPPVDPIRQGLLDRLRQMSNAERIYFIATCALSLAVALVAIAIIVFSTFGGSSYCTSKECVRTAAQIIGSINSSADPCKDFYEFACGGWKKIGGVEEDNWSQSRRLETTRKAAVLLARWNSITDLEAVRKARTIFQTCMDIDHLDTLGLGPLIELLEIAGLPKGIPNSETVADFDLSRTLARVHATLGKAVLLDVLREDNETFRVSTTPLDITNMPNLAALEAIHEIWIDWNDLNRTHLSKNSTVKADWQEFVKNVKNLVEDLDALRPGQSFGMSELGNKSNFLPPNMKKKRLSASEITNILYNGTDPKDVFNTLNYEVYMDTLFNGNSDINWNLNNGTIRLADPEYHSVLVSALQRFSPVQAQMLVWTEVIKHFGVHTTTKFRQKLRNREFAMKFQPPRSEICANLVISLMPIVVDHLIAQLDPIEEVTEQAKAMAMGIQYSYRELFQNAKWLDRSGLKNVSQHLDKVKFSRIGYVDWVKEGEGLDVFFENVLLYEDSLLLNIANIQVWQTETNFLVSPKIGRLRTDPVMVDAYYDRSMDTVTVRPIIMQFPFFPLGLEALNYGAMGLLIAHEFGRILDTEAFADDNYFSLENPAIDKFDGFVNCTRRRVLEISAKLNVSVNPELSTDDYIADISAIKTAFFAFNELRTGPEPHLPHLENFTHDQLFFLALGNAWCTRSNPIGANADNRPYLDNRIRMLSAVSNTPEFAKAWDCPADSPMSPKDKCTLW